MLVTNNLNLKLLAIDYYQIEDSLTDKISRVANPLLLGVGIAASFSLLIDHFHLVQPLPFLPYPLALLSSCLSALVIAKVIKVVLGYLVYPAAALSKTSSFFTQERVKQGEENLQALKELNFITHKIIFHKAGISYSGLLVGHESTFLNKKWSLHGLGNMQTMEDSIKQLAQKNLLRKCNTLVINGPSVMESKGLPTRYQLGAGLEVALVFLEKEVKATHIILQGLSLGAGMLSEAILQHDFKSKLTKTTNTKYLVISQITFSKLSEAASAITNPLAKAIFKVLDVELDCVKAATKLSQISIKQILIQHKSEDNKGTDGVIPDKASLAYALKQKGIFKKKCFLESENVRHSDYFPVAIKEPLEKKIKKFLNQ